MKTVEVIRYVDAFYTDNVSGLSGAEISLPLHVAIGSTSLDHGEVFLFYASVDGKPQKGLYIPLGALILEDQTQNREGLQVSKGQTIGVYWKDIVHFEDHRAPRGCSVMYTEGRVFNLASNAIVIENPETIRTVSGRVGNHPEQKPKYYVIPFSFITKTEHHD